MSELAKLGTNRLKDKHNKEKLGKISKKVIRDMTIWQKNHFFKEWRGLGTT